MFFCKECGGETIKWSGKCPHCGAWNSLKEASSVVGKQKKRKLHTNLAPRAQAGKLNQVEIKATPRLQTGIGEFDGTLGGGIVPGMAVLIGGEPGIGKSTLLLQVANQVADLQKKVLYVSGEESREQIGLRGKRLHCAAEELFLLCCTEVKEILQNIEELQPDLVVIDSIQSVYTETLDNAPGSLTQLRECTALFTRMAKQQNIPIFLIGHVTKDGAVAGPKIIEHMVDTVLYFEGEQQKQFKILRATKNRFGSTNEIGIFQMQSDGLQEVADPSELFFNRQDNSNGTAISCVIEGSRAFLLEVQALVTGASYGNSQRVALGLDHRKLSLLLALIDKNLGLDLKNNDVFVNLIGGIKVAEPAVDLATIAAILSSLKEMSLPQGTILIGEVGLNGEVRPVNQAEKRIKEAKKLGYDNIIISARTQELPAQIKVTKIKHIRQLFPILFG
ncbi:MAG: DNA repair protein RadA [Candidatus Cloacimonadales bacterium]